MNNPLPPIPRQLMIGVLTCVQLLVATGSPDPVRAGAVRNGLPAPVRPAEQSVSGTITDEKGDALPGVSISVQGTTRGTITAPASTTSPYPTARWCWCSVS